MANKDVGKLVKRQIELSKKGLSGQFENTEKCFQFYDGHDSAYSDYIQYQETGGAKRRALVNFNKIQSNVDAVVGFMAQNRRQAKFVARPTGTESQQDYSKNMNALYEFHREGENADHVETDQDNDMLVCGYGATDTDLTYTMGKSTTDPNGEILKKVVTRTVYWDPKARAKNNLDANWVGYHEDFDLKDALNLFQSSKEDDFEEAGAEENGDSGYQYNPYGGVYDKIKAVDSVEWSSKEQEMVRVRNHQWLTFETFYIAANPLYIVSTPEDALYIQMRLEAIQSEIKLNGPDDIDAKDAFYMDILAEEFSFDEETKGKLVKEFGALIKPIPFKRKVYNTAIVSGEHVFTTFRSICQDGFTIKFKTGIFNESAKHWIGMINSMMEPQKYYNKAITEVLFTIAANSKGGVMVEEGAVEDISDFESKWAKTDAVIKVNTGALAGQMIQEKTRAAVPTGLENIIQLSDAAISAAGVDPSFLGQMDNDDQSGILYKRRIRQVISKMARYFDSLTLYQKEDAKLHVDLIRIWVQNNNGKWIPITGEAGKEGFIQVSEEMLSSGYNVTIQEASQTPEDRQQIAGVLGTYGDKIIQLNPTAGMAFYAESLQLLPIDGDVRSRLAKLLTPQEQPPIDPQYVQSLEQQIQKLQSMQDQALVENTQAQTELTRAKTQESRANLGKVDAGIQQTHATTAKTLEEAKKTAVELDRAIAVPDANISLSI